MALFLCIILNRLCRILGETIVKRVYVLVILILCGAAIIYGNLHWNHKISAQGEDKATVKETEEVKEEPKNANENVDVAAYTSNLSEDLQAKIKNAKDSGEPLELIIYGSDATSEETGAWPDLLTKKLIDTYGEDIFKITVISEGTQTSRDIVNERSYEEVSNVNPDVILFEPFMLKDNDGLIGMENTIENIEIMMDSWKTANKDVTILIQPPNPLYNANFYPSQVNDLKEYVENEGIVYLNHWEKWPELDDPKMEDYLSKVDDQPSQPNGSGNKVWAEYLIEFFIAE